MSDKEMKLQSNEFVEVSRSEREKQIADIINNRRIINGPEDKFHSISTVRYPWAIDLLERMMNNEWFPKRIGLARDRKQYIELDRMDGKRVGLDRSLSFLTNLDAIQVKNLALNISQHITDPTILLCMYRQIWEEALHVTAYSYVIENVCDDQMHIYDMYNVNPVLKQKNDFITAQADAMREEGFTPENFLYALISNILLEGVYFHSGFLYFYVMEKMHRMFLGSTNEVRYIQRDETSHVVLFTKILMSFLLENRGLVNNKVREKIMNLIVSGTNLEIAWGQHIIEYGVPGINDYTVDQHIKCLANKRVHPIAEILGIEEPFKNVEDPYPWVEAASKVNSQEKNFFEGKPTEYSKKNLQFSDDDDD